MTGQISGLPLELVAVVVAASMLLGAVDILRQPGWAWKQAGEPKVAYLILDLILPVIGLAMYAFRARPKVIAEAATGPAAGPDEPALPVEPGERALPAEDTRAQGTPAPADTGPVEPVTRAAAGTDPFTGFREMADHQYRSGETTPSPPEPERLEISSTFFSTGTSARNIRHPLALARAYRPRQRTSLTEDQPEPVVEEVGQPEPERAPVVDFQPGPAIGVEVTPQPAPTPAPSPAVEPEPKQARVVEPEPEQAGVVEPEQVRMVEPEPEPETVSPIAYESPTVPSGWKVDPTGRHQFRYWDGFTWTANVADNGEETLDAVSA